MYLALLVLSIFFLNIAETKSFHFHRIFKNGVRGGVSSEPSEPLLDPRLKPMDRCGRFSVRTAFSCIEQTKSITCLSIHRDQYYCQQKKKYHMAPDKSSSDYYLNPGLCKII